MRSGGNGASAMVGSGDTTGSENLRMKKPGGNKAYGAFTSTVYAWYAIFMIYLIAVSPAVLAAQVNQQSIQVTYNPLDRTELQISYETDVPVQTHLSYRTGDDEYSVSDREPSTSHSFTLTKLQQETAYIYWITGDGINQVTKSFRTLGPPPEIEEIKLLAVSQDSARIRYAASEEVSATLFYGTTSDASSQQIEEETLQESSSFLITGLTDGVEYYYKVELCDRNNDCILSGVDSFVAGVDSTPQYIEASVPAYVNDFEYDVTGTTKSESFVNLTVNGLLSSLAFADGEGKFALRAVGLRDDIPNELVLTSRDLVGEAVIETYTLVVDTRAPIVSMRELPSVTFENPFKMNGSVNEEVTITWSVVTEDPVAVEKVNIVSQAQRRDEGYVEFSWNSQAHSYIVFRDDIGPIAVVENTSYKDSTVVPGTTYVYTVQPISSRGTGKAGATSTGVSFAIPSDWPQPLLQASLVDISEYADVVPTQDIVVSGDFEFALDLLEGENTVSIVVSDFAGNTVDFSGEILVDTTPPEILEPLDLSVFSPAFSPGVEIVGEVDTPGAEVIVLVNGKDTSENTIPASISGVIEKFSGTKNYRTTADANGKFKVTIELEQFQELGLTNASRRGLDNDEVGGSGFAGFGGSQNNYLNRQFVDNKITIIVIDQVGQRTILEDSIEYRSCGEDGAWKVDIPEGEMRPLSLQSEHLMKGIAQFGFNAHLKYQGAGIPETARVTGVPKITVFELSENEKEKRGYTADLLSTPTHSYSADYSLNHFLYRLKKWDGTEDELRDLAYSGLSDLSRLHFPIMIEFPFSHDVYGTQVTGYHRECTDLYMPVEMRLDVEGKIPEEFLEGSIDVINQTTRLIDMLLEPLMQVQQVLFFSCLGSWIILFLYDSIVNELYCWFHGVRDEAINQLAITEKWPGSTNGELDNVACASSDKNDECMSCMQGFSDFRMLNNKMHLLCDRVFCPPVPSLQKHADEYTDSLLGGIGGKRSACEGKTERGYYDKKSVAVTQGTKGVFGLGIFSGGATSQDGCEIEYRREWDHACLLMDEWKETTTDPSTKSGFATLYDTVADMCTEKPKENNWYETEVKKTKSREKTVRNTKTGEEVTTVETTTESQDQVVIKRDGKVYLGHHRRSSSGTSQVVGLRDSTDPDFKHSTSPLVRRYDQDGKPADDHLYFDKDGDGKYSDGDVQSKIDVGQSEDLRKEFSPPPRYIVNPTSGILRSIQCGCIPAVVSFLSLWKSILEAVKKCFQSILITKQAKSGMCKAVLTTYICDMVFNALDCITTKYGAGSGAKVKKGIASGVGNFMGAMSSSVNKIQTSVSNRYGETSVFRNLFSKRQLIHTLCIGAFTGDWDLNVEGFLQGALRVPVASEGFLPVATRRFVTSDPNNDGLATFYYHTSSGLVAGADLDWKIELVCSNSHTCPELDNPEDACDCAMPGIKEERTRRIAAGSLRAGEAIGGDDDVGDRYDVVTDRVRYDKARLTWTQKDNLGKLQTEFVENDINRVGQGPTASCSFDLGEVAFVCEAIIPDTGKAKFLSKPEPKRDVYRLGDNIEFDIEISKKSPGFKHNDPKTANKQIPKWLGYRLYNQNGVPISIGPPTQSSTPTNDNWKYKQLFLDGLYETDAREIDFDLDIIPQDSGFKIHQSHFRALSNDAPKGKIRFYTIKGTKELRRITVAGDSTLEQKFLVLAKKGNATPVLKNAKIDMSSRDDETYCQIYEIDQLDVIQGQQVINFSALGDSPFDSAPVVNTRCDPSRARVEHEGLTVTIRDHEAVGKMRVITYVPNAPTTAEADSCPEGKQTWKMDFVLYQGTRLFKEKDWDSDNFDDNVENHGPVVTGQGGVKEEYVGSDAVEITVICRESERANTDCPEGRLDRRCACNKREEISCGGPSEGKYCYGPSGEEACHGHPLNVCSYDVLNTKDCDCNMDGENQTCGGKMCIKSTGECEDITPKTAYASVSKKRTSIDLNDLMNMDAASLLDIYYKVHAIIERIGSDAKVSEDQRDELLTLIGDAEKLGKDKDLDASLEDKLRRHLNDIKEKLTELEEDDDT